MTKLCFKYATMNSGKTIDLLRTAYNYEENGYKVLVMKPSVDTKGDNKIVTRIGLSRDVDILIQKDSNAFELLKDKVNDISAVFIDEAQFLTTNQVRQLFEFAHVFKIPVMCYGLRNNFKMKAFEGSAELLAISDDLQEIKTMCSCGQTARYVGRKLNGVYEKDGPEIVIDGTNNYEYIPLCGDCYLKNVLNIDYEESQKVKRLIKE